MLKLRLIIPGLLAASLATAPLAHAGADPEEIYQSALADMKAGNPAAACPKFAEARRLKPDSTAALQGLALCNDALGKSASAWARYRELTVELKTHGDAERSQAAANRAEELGKIVSTVVIRVDSRDTPGLIIRLDKDEVPQAMLATKMNVDPGPHVLEATAPGYEVWQTTFTIGKPREARDVQVPTLLAIARPTAPFWGAQRAAGVGIAGAGIVGVVVGSVFGSVALKKLSDAKSQGHCDADWATCDATGLQMEQDSRKAAHASTAGLVTGGAALVTGIILFATASAASGAPAPKSGARVTLAPMAGANLTGVLLRGGW